MHNQPQSQFKLVKLIDGIPYTVFQGTLSDCTANLLNKYRRSGATHPHKETVLDLMVRGWQIRSGGN